MTGGREPVATLVGRGCANITLFTHTDSGWQLKETAWWEKRGLTKQKNFNLPGFRGVLK